jgi:hypothetical protein
MNQSFDLGTEALSVSVAETIAWCERQKIVGTVDESEEIKRRRNLGKQARELIRRAYAERGDFGTECFDGTTCIVGCGNAVWSGTAKPT